MIKFTSIFYKLRVLLPNDALKSLNFALVYPHLLYGIEVYGAASMSKLDKLIKLNNKILRILQWKRLDYPVKLLYQNYKTLPIPALHNYQILVFMFKYVHLNNCLPPAFTNYLVFNSSIHSHNIRGSNDIHFFTVSGSSGSKTLMFKGSKL